MAHHNKVQQAERDLIRSLRHSGLSVAEVAVQTGRSERTVKQVVADAGGLPPRRTGRAEDALTLAEREEISRGLVTGMSFRAIARGLGRPPSTVSREVNANGGRDTYRAVDGEHRAVAQAVRPKPTKLETNTQLREVVEDRLERCWSPQQIEGRLPIDYPDDPEMRVSHETIYQAIYVQGRGTLAKEISTALRSGRTQRKPHTRTSSAAGGKGRIPGMVNISERPAEVEDRAVPGHWEGDLMIGKSSRSAVGTVVECTSRFTMLLHLPDSHTAEAVREALVRQVGTLPAQIWRSLTWDQGKEMAQHLRFSVATGIDVYFCDPHSPWQRGTNENTNGLLRQFLPKGTDLSIYSQEDLDEIAALLNGRPRETLGFMTPSEKFAELVAFTA